MGGAIAMVLEFSKKVCCLHSPPIQAFNTELGIAYWDFGYQSLRRHD
jgi:hypothetical protein